MQREQLDNILREESERAARIAGNVRDLRRLRDAAPRLSVRRWQYARRVRRLERAIVDIAATVERRAWERAVLATPDYHAAHVALWEGFHWSAIRTF